MPYANILIVCSELSHAQMYVIDLVNISLQMGKVVHIVQQNRIGDQGPGNSGLLPENNMIRANDRNLRLHTPKDTEQSTLVRIIKEQRCNAVIFVCKDGENRFALKSKLPTLSIFVLLLNYVNIPKKTRNVIEYFDVLIGTGEHSADSLHALNLGKPTRVIFPKMLSRTFEPTSTSSAKTALGMNPNRFVFLLDVNDSPEIKSVDTVIQAYAQCQKRFPGFKERATLLINAAPTVQLVNILKLETFTPEEVSVHIQYYSNGMDRNENLLNHLLASSDCVVNMSAGIDFDTHLFLAQEYKKLVIYRDCEKTRQYCSYGIPVKQQQIYFDGLAQGILYLPSVEKLEEAMHLVLERFYKFAMSDVTMRNIVTFREKNDRFEKDWQTYLTVI